MTFSLVTDVTSYPLGLPGRLNANANVGDKRIEEASALYEQGGSLAKIGKRFGVSPSTVRDALLTAGLHMRPPSGKRTH